MPRRVEERFTVHFFIRAALVCIVPPVLGTTLSMGAILVYSLGGIAAMASIAPVFFLPVAVMPFVGGFVISFVFGACLCARQLRSPSSDVSPVAGEGRASSYSPSREFPLVNTLVELRQEASPPSAPAPLPPFGEVAPPPPPPVLGPPLRLPSGGRDVSPPPVLLPTTPHARLSIMHRSGSLGGGRGRPPVYSGSTPPRGGVLIRGDGSLAPPGRFLRWGAGGSRLAFPVPAPPEDPGFSGGSFAGVSPPVGLASAPVALVPAVQLPSVGPVPPSVSVSLPFTVPSGSNPLAPPSAVRRGSGSSHASSDSDRQLLGGR